jgi:hypothetical protein
MKTPLCTQIFEGSGNMQQKSLWDLPLAPCTGNHLAGALELPHHFAPNSRRFAAGVDVCAAI